MNDAFPNPCKPGKCPKPYVCNRSTKTCKNKKGKSRSKSPSLKKSKSKSKGKSKSKSPSLKKSKSLNKSPIKQTPNVFTIAIITIYRNDPNNRRKMQMEKFIHRMKHLHNCDTYIIEQSDDGEAFNIGKLKNVGYDIASKVKKYDNYIFCDIDTLPSPEIIDYFYTHFDHPVSLAVRGTRYVKGNPSNNGVFFGAMVMFSASQFERVNGYPNNFWGWGGEDDAILSRIYQTNKKIIYPKKGHIEDTERDDKHRLISVKDKVKNEVKEAHRIEKYMYDIGNWKINGIHNLEYRVLTKSLLFNNSVIKNTISIYKVDLKKSTDMKKTPELYDIHIDLPYNEMKQIFKKTKQDYKRIKILYK